MCPRTSYVVYSDSIEELVGMHTPESSHRSLATIYIEVGLFFQMVLVGDWKMFEIMDIRNQEITHDYFNRVVDIDSCVSGRLIDSLLNEAEKMFNDSLAGDSIVSDTPEDGVTKVSKSGYNLTWAWLSLKHLYQAMDVLNTGKYRSVTDTGVFSNILRGVVSEDNYILEYNKMVSEVEALIEGSEVYNKRISIDYLNNKLLKIRF